MNLTDVARKRTLPLRDTLAAVERRRDTLIGEQLAEQERIKRLYTEFSGHRGKEQALKKRLGQAEAEIVGVRAEIEELERQRSVLFERYTALTETKSGAEAESKSIQHEEKVVGEAVKSAQDRLRRVEQERTQIESEHAGHQLALKRAYSESFAEYSSLLRGRITGAMGGQAERLKRVEVRKRFMDARHTTPEVGQLCDERDELRAILDSSRVPAVKELLSTRLKVIETRIEELFPGGLTADLGANGDGFVAEIFYMREAEDGFVLLLPFDGEVWHNMAASEGPTDEGNAAAAVFFGIAKGLGLKPADGEFRLEGGRVAYVGRFDDAEIAVMASTAISLPGLPDVYLNLSRMPSEIEEALRGDETRS